MKVLVFGSVNIDLVFSVEHIVCGGETLQSSSLVRSAGGKGANQAVALAKAGLQTWFAGKIGVDGVFLQEKLEALGVCTRHLARYGGATGQAIIQLDRQGQNAIVLYAGGNAEIRRDEVDTALEAFGKNDLLVVQNEIPLTGFVMEAATKKGMKIALNPSPFDGRAENLPLGLADILFVNEIEGARLARLPTDAPHPAILDALAERFAETELVLTAGKDGAYYAFGRQRAQSGIINVSVVDTTGAGDTFSGFFIAARARGHSPAQALAAACKASSIAVSRLGAMDSIPSAYEVF